MKKAISLIFLSSVIACNFDDNDLESNPIDSNIRIELREVLGTDSKELTLFCQTEKTYPCSNFSLLTDQDKLNITFTKVKESVACLTALGPASIVIKIPAMENGSYPIELNNARLSNLGTLTVTDEKIDLHIKKPRGITIVRHSTQRVPPNTYWGTIGYHTESTTAQVEDFLNKVSELGSRFNKQTPGHYFYYEIDKNGDIITDSENSGYYFTKAFIFQHEGDEEQFKKDIKELSKKYFSDMYINMETFRGERIYNWN